MSPAMMRTTLIVPWTSAIRPPFFTSFISTRWCFTAFVYGSNVFVLMSGDSYTCAARYARKSAERMQPYIQHGEHGEQV